MALFVRHALRLTALAVACSAGAALASPLVINTGSDYNLEPDGSIRTAAFSSLGLSGTQATRIYLGDPSSAGTTVVMTNIPSIMAFYGFSNGTKTTIGGGSVALSFPSSPSQNNVDALNGVGSTGGNGFTAGVSFPQYGTGASGNGKGGAWGLAQAFQWVGTTVDVDRNGSVDRIDYSTGVMSVFYLGASSDANNGKEVLRLILDASGQDELHGTVDYSYALADSFIQNFFNDAGAGASLFSQWQASPTSVIWSLDMPLGVDGPATLWNSGSSLIAQSLFDGRLTIGDPTPNTTVPEPGTMLLAGLALLGLAASRRTPR